MLIVILLLQWLVLVTLLISLATLRSRLTRLQDDITVIRLRMIPPNIGGRAAPSMADLQAAKNRMDAMGVAHPGGPSG